MATSKTQPAKKTSTQLAGGSGKSPTRAKVEGAVKRVGDAVKKANETRGSAARNVQAAVKKGGRRARKALEGREKVVAGTAVGVAVAAAAGLVAFRTLRGRERSVYHLMPHEKGWQVTKQGRKAAVSVHEQKKDARDAARELAHKNEPSQLVIHRTDGTIQTVHTYGE